MFTKHRKWILLALLAVITNAHGLDISTSNFVATTWKNEDGLPHSTINAIAQTRDGYMWIGTHIGLVRFDGIQFFHYFSGNVPELEAGQISCLFEDKDGTLWVALESGRLLAWKNGSVRICLVGNDGKSPLVVAMAQDGEGRLWVQGGNGQLYRLTETGIESLANTGANLNRANRSLIVDSGGQLWVGTSRGLKIWHEDQLITPPALMTLMDGPVDTASLARDGNIWMYRSHRICKISAKGIVEEVAVPDEVDGATSMLETSDGRLWLGAGRGTLYCREPGTSWVEISKSAVAGLNRVLFEDHEGNLWRGSYAGGLTRVRPRLFRVYDLPDLSLDKYVRAVSADSLGNVWAVLNGQSLAFLPAGSDQPVQSGTNTLSKMITTITTDHANNLWLGTIGGRMYRMQKGDLVSAPGLTPGVEMINALYEDAEMNMWVGYTGGAGIGVFPHGELAKWHTLEGLGFPDVRCITRTMDGTLWLGTHYGGIFCQQNGAWKQFTSKDGLPSDYVRCFYLDSDGTVWIGTLYGLCRWRNGKFAAITSEHGLWNDSISHIATDSQGNFWISSFRGIFRVKRQQLNDFAYGRIADIQCIGYDRDDGLPSVECPGGFQPAGTQTPDGRLWFPTTSGLVSVPPGSLKENILPPPVWVERITVDGKVQKLNGPQAIIAPPGTRRFDFRFTAPSFIASEKIRFRHKLEGLDKDWSPAAEVRAVTYSYIPPGDYTFKVIACNNDGVWNTTGTSVGLVVKPFFWQTWWFKICATLFLIVAVGGAVRRVERWKARLRLERLERQHAVERERTRIAKDIHDDLGANLTRIVFLSQRAEIASNDAAEVERWIQMIPATARRTIQSLDEIVWAINPKHDSLDSLANYLSQFVHEHLTLAGLRCVLDVPTVLPPMPLSAEVRHNIVLTIREAVQNAVKHAEATEVRVALEVDAKSLRISIADNGRGFIPGAETGRRNGLANMRRRVEDLGGHFELNSQPGGGTVIRLTLASMQLHGRVIENGNHPHKL